jgi:hypothetical protein
VIAHTPLDPQAQGTDLARLGATDVAPAARMTIATTRRYAERGTGRDHRRLERANERPDHEPAIREGDDRIRHELARAVVRHLAAAFRPNDLDPPGRERRRAGEDVGHIGRPPERQDRRMLEEEQLIRDSTVGTLGDQPMLQVMGLAVRHPAKPRRGDRPRSGVDPVRPWASVSIATRAR